MSVNETDKIAIEAAELAKEWQELANKLLDSKEKKLQNQMARLLRNPLDKVILTKMIDQSFRSENFARISNQLEDLLSKYGIPKFFSGGEKFLTQLFLSVGKLIPTVSVPKMIDKIRSDSSDVIIAGEKDSLVSFLKKRKKEGVRMNINHLGEAVLGEDESKSRLDTYIADMKDPNIEYISVKISTIYSQINSLAIEQTLEILMDRLSILYRHANENFYVRANGERVKKFVNMDMEEYRDLEITVELFRRTLDKEEFKDYSAGIVLQAYMPDSYNEQKELTEWAKKRVADGGAPVKIRIVKGANMEMEMVESSIFNWPLAPYDNKLEVDANYKRMVEFGMQPENIKAVNLGIASHNLFELAFALKIAEKNDVVDHFNFELLEGMADHVRRAIQERSGDVLLYAPVATKDQFINAIAYLVRRLDENTAKENFLRYASNLKTNSKEWDFLKDQFINSYNYRDKAGANSHKIQDRSNEKFPSEMGTFYEGEFVNEPDTDWSLATNRKWAESIREKWQNKETQIPIVVAGEELFEGKTIKDGFDPATKIGSNKEKWVKSAQFALADADDAERAIQTAKNDPDGWRSKTYDERNLILSKVAMEMRKNRGDLIGAAAANTGKTFVEGDVEVSEAIDFAEFYPFSAKAVSERENVDVRGKGTGLVISPWNFPLAIPCGGVISSLAAGNTVIFKPASDAVLSAWELCKCFWNAGVSKNTLQFVPCSGASVGPKLTNHPDIDFIILTGGTDTGLSILNAKPGVFLAAETGGKNATIVTSVADRDQAIKNVIHSAFGNTGQKCSATSLLILEKEVYEDKNFKKQLIDATRSLSVGPAWDFKNKISNLINPPSGDLEKGLTTLEDGEEWVLKPEMINDNENMWTPGIKYGVKQGSYTHMTEFFGPVLAVIEAKNLDHAIEIVNQTGFGLTSGIESLDKREQEKWKNSINAGNLYVNRGTTGAIVLRQPFGGMGKSAIGSGIKAGGPNYVTQLMEIEDKGFPKVGSIDQDHLVMQVASRWNVKINWGMMAKHKEDLHKTIRAYKSYLYEAEQEFKNEKDYFHLRGQDNIVRYLPIGTVMVRLHEEDTLFETLARVGGVLISGCKMIVSIPKELSNDVTDFLLGVEGRFLTDNSSVLFQTDDEVIEYLGKVQRVRYAAQDRVPAKVFEAAAKTGFYIARTEVTMDGRFELLQYVKEQSICDSYHRYGNIGERALT
ncbi:MAG: bifunctional proline dehydrogenase/L-glutamate gamma-semialdehyde dehydrogenase [Desulfobacterales bacterium]|nr:bifunctional proline dehydrogenase/L-glutamate gamma-semialdehyde dehydrogenase [Desulfobacterales bacterium]MCP4158565.1 bifunctional proline dehydrogenase/L-glutamate gamma-semialdehyde dehydrogenase [Deltaproteobacteria bacterium]